jgi:hypothetical protein
VRRANIFWFIFSPDFRFAPGVGIQEKSIPRKIQGRFGTVRTGAKIRLISAGIDDSTSKKNDV